MVDNENQENQEVNQPVRPFRRSLFRQNGINETPRLADITNARRCRPPTPHPRDLAFYQPYRPDTSPISPVQEVADINTSTVYSATAEDDHEAQIAPLDRDSVLNHEMTQITGEDLFLPVETVIDEQTWVQPHRDPRLNYLVNHAVGFAYDTVDYGAQNMEDEHEIVVDDNDYDDNDSSDEDSIIVVDDDDEPDSSEDDESLISFPSYSTLPDLGKLIFCLVLVKLKLR